MDKKEIIRSLDSFPYDKEDYWLTTGGAMVLYGIKEETADIDLGCSKRLADRLEKDGHLAGCTDDGNRWFRYGDDIEIFENWLKGGTALVDGIPVITIEGLIEMKRELGREKDMRDIALIEEYRGRK